MTRRSLDREIARLALPALGSLAVEPLVSLVDTGFVGRLGAAALAAVAVGGAILGVSFALFRFLEYAVTPAVATALGAGDTRRVGQTTASALGVALVGGLAAAAVISLAAPTLVRLLGAGAEVLPDAASYLAIRALALPAVLLAMVGHGVYRGRHDTRTPLLVSLVANGLNLALDPLLIFGAGWGVIGAAWASVIAQAVAGVWFLVLLLRTPSLTPSRAAAGSLGRAAVALVVRTGALIATLTGATAVAARVGTAEVAAHQIALQLWFFLALVLDALAIAAQAMVGRASGASDLEGARFVTRRLLVLGTATGAVIALLLVAARPWVGGWFTPDAEVVVALGLVYPLLVVAQPVNGFVFVGDGVVIGAEDFRFLAGSTVAASIVAATVLVGVIPWGWGLPGVWWAILALTGVRAVTMGWWVVAFAGERGRAPGSRAA